MRTRGTDLLYIFLIIVLLAVIAGVAWLTWQYIVPLGGDQVYAPLWEAARYVSAELGGQPYSPDAVARARILLGDADYPPRFVYPYYSLLLIEPFARISPYSLSRAVWMAFCLVCYTGLVFVAMMLTRWRPGIWGGLAFALFAFGRPDVHRALFVGNPALVVGLLMGIGLLMVVREQYGLAGVFFGLTVLKPNLSVLLLVFVFLWAISHRRMGMVLSLLVVSLGLIGGSVVLFPQWPLLYYQELLAFYPERFPSSPAAVVWTWMPNLGPRVMLVVAVALMLVLLVSWWQALGKGPRWFLWTAALTITVTLLVGLPVSPSDHVVLLVPFTLAFSTWAQRWRGAGTQLAIVMMALTAGASWLVFWLTMDLDLTAPASDAILFVMPLTAAVLLYWARYWALHSIRLKTSHLDALRRL